MITSKIAADLCTHLTGADEETFISVIVRHRRTAFSAQQVVAGAEVGHRYRLMSATAMKVKPGEIEMLAADEAVDFVWPDLPVHTCLDVSVPRIHAQNSSFV